MIEESFFANINVISNGDAQYNWIHGSLVLTSAQHHAPLLVYLKVNFFRHEMTSPSKIWDFGFEQRNRMSKTTQKLKLTI